MSIEKSVQQSKGTGGKFLNGADLGLKAMEQLNENQNLPFCPGPTKVANQNKLILFFTHSNENSQPVQFPEFIQNYVNSGAKIVIFTFNWNEYFEAEKLVK